MSPHVEGDTVLSLGEPLALHLKNTDRIDEAIVSIDLQRDPSIKSTIAFGFVDEAKFPNKREPHREDLAWMDIQTTGQLKFSWSRLMHNVFYNGSKIDSANTSAVANFDSFFSGVHLPIDVWVSLMRSIQSNLTSPGKNYL